MQKKPKVLFLSTGDSSRGVMAEGFLKTLAGEHFQGATTGIQGSDVHPLAIDVMGEVGIDISTHQPKSVTESLRDQFGYVVIVYDSAKERSPIFPFSPHLLHWSIANPATVQGSPTEKAAKFRSVRDEIRNKIEGFVNEFANETPSVHREPMEMVA